MKCLSIACIAVLLTGCASTASKNAVEEFSRAGTAYAQVVEVADADRYSIRSRCAEMKGDEAMRPICANLGMYDVARTVILRLNRWILNDILVPKSEQIKDEYIVQVDPSQKLAGFRRIAAKVPNETCRWDGPISWKTENSLPAAVGGFFAGMLIVPAVVVLSSDDLLAGGVVCEGWSYRSLVKQETK